MRIKALKAVYKPVCYLLDSNATHCGLLAFCCLLCESRASVIDLKLFQRAAEAAVLNLGIKQ